MSQSSHSALSVQTIESTANSILVITFLLSSDNVKNIVSTLNPSYSSLCADDETNPLYQKYLVLVSALAQEWGCVFQIVKYIFESLIVSSLEKICSIVIDQHKNGKTSLESCNKFLVDFIKETYLRSILIE